MIAPVPLLRLRKIPLLRLPLLRLCQCHYYDCESTTIIIAPMPQLRLPLLRLCQYQYYDCANTTATIVPIPLVQFRQYHYYECAEPISVNPTLESYSCKASYGAGCCLICCSWCTLAMIASTHVSYLNVYTLPRQQSSGDAPAVQHCHTNIPATTLQQSSTATPTFQRRQSNSPSLPHQHSSVDSPVVQHCRTSIPEARLQHSTIVNPALSQKTNALPCTASLTLPVVKSAGGISIEVSVPYTLTLLAVVSARECQHRGISSVHLHTSSIHEC